MIAFRWRIQQPQKGGQPLFEHAAARWRHVHASVIGTSHVTGGTPCQDAHICEVIEDVDGDQVLIVAVADGAGSALFSDRGAQLACRTIVDGVREHLVHLRVGAVDELAAAALVERARGAITKVADEANCSTREFACTLLCAIVATDVASFFQIGDGAMVVAPDNDADHFSWIFWPERGEFANTTSFITDVSWRDALVYDRAPGAVNEIAVFSDGLQGLVLDQQTRAAHDPFFHRVFSPLRQTKDTGHLASLSSALARYLGSPKVNERTDDDKTLVLASRRVT